MMLPYLLQSFCLLLIIVVAEIAAGVWGYINRESLEAHIRASVKNTVREDYDKDENVRNLFNTIQTKVCYNIFVHFMTVSNY